MIAKRLIFLVLVFTALCLSCEAMAQSDIAFATRKAKLETLSETLKQRDKADRQQAQAFARRTGIPMRRELPNGKVLELQRISAGKGPVFYITNNLDAADSVSTEKVWPGGSAGLSLDGSGMTVGEWDGGAVYAGHPDFTGRLNQVDGATLVSGHSTHVAGTLIGSGDWLEPRSRGMAYAAQLNAWDWNSDTAEMAAAAAGGLLSSNHSYGIAAGWLYYGDVPPNTWWWIGGAADTDVEDPYFGYYDSQSQLWDQIAYDAPFYLIVKAAGNDRSDTGPSPGEEYTVIDQDGNPLFTSTLPRNADCAPAGYDCLPTNSVAKNVLTVGAVDDVYGGYSPLSGPSQVQMAPFSGWGPTDDGRIKPDVVGNGVFLISAWPDSPYYAAAAGTSMAAPNVTGSLLLLQEHYQDLHGAGNFMRSSTVKALAIHTADEAGSADGPDYAFGWGMLNTAAATRVITGDGGSEHRIIEGSLVNSANDTVQFNVTQADSVLTATLVWTDPPGTPVELTLDSPALMLKNDLDLRIISAPDTYLPWVLNPAIPAAAATTGDNTRDNVEQVKVSNAETGTYTIEVSHKGNLLNGTNQAYSLIISQTAPLPTGSSLIIDEDFSGGLPAGWSVDTIMGIPWTINSPIPGNSRLDNLTGGSGQFAIVDNGYAYQTITSLQTPPVDLSSATAAVLRFRSNNGYDTFESFNVDISTNGGSGWINVWNFIGFNPFPSLNTVDISGAAAGHASVMLRFRFDSGGYISGDYWQIDDVELDAFGITPPPDGDPPGTASNPIPASGSSDLGVNTTLAWSAGSLATSHDVYFGTDSTPDASEYQGNQAGTAIDPGTLLNSTTYYWRIDELNADGTTSGPVWSFTTEALPVQPGIASNPGPTNGASGVSTNVNLSWTEGSDTTSHDVHFGTSPSPALQVNQGSTTYIPGTLASSITYYWQINEVNANGTTTGPVWSFTTEALPVQPGIASNPGPANGASGVSTSVNLSWTEGSDTTSHDVYFGTSPAPAFQLNQGSGSYNPGILASSTTYYWQIDEVNGALKTTGPVWNFTTAAAPSFHIAALNVVSESVKGPRNHGVATITIEAASGSANGVSVSGTFGGDWDGTRSGTTNSSGQLVVTTPPVKNGNNWSFCVDTASKAGMEFDLALSAAFLCDPPPPPPATTGSVSGIVRDASNSAPIQGASVSADSGQGDTSAADGSYTLASVPTGNHTITINASGYESSSPTTTVSDDATSTLNVSLIPTPPAPSGSISGVVTNASNGSPVQGASVSADSGQGDTTAADGSYTLATVPTGTRTVTVNASGFDSASPVTTVADGATRTLNISLTPTPTGGGTGTLKGTVRNSSGALLRDVLVQVAGGPSAITNKRGKYTIRNVPEGSQNIIASHSGYGDFPVTVTITTGQTTTANITFP